MRFARGVRSARGSVLSTLFGVSSLLTPFALGAAIGGIASERVPLGNAAGDAIGSWLNPTSIAVGALAVLTSAYLAAVWLTADAARGERDDDLVHAFRWRALAAGALAGAMALGGLLVLSADAEGVYDGLTSGAGLAALLAWAAAGIATMAFVAHRRLEAARWSAPAGRRRDRRRLGARAASAGAPGADRRAGCRGRGHARRAARLAGRRRRDPDPVARTPVRARPARTLRRATRRAGLARAHGPRADRDRCAGVVPWHPAGVVAAVCAALGVPLTLLSDGGTGLVLGVVLLLAAVAAAAVFVVPQVALGEPEDR